MALPFIASTHAYHAKNVALLEIVEHTELDEISAENLEHAMNQEKEAKNFDTQVTAFW